MAQHFPMMASLPESDLFTFPPSAPAAFPPAPASASIMHPFNIPAPLFTAALHPVVPLALAASYAVTVKALSKYNRGRGKKPWGISKTRPFFAFVVAHNIFLAVYSAWTFWGMLGGMRRSIANPFGPGGIAATADSFCRLHGEAGLGSSVYFNETGRTWGSVAANPAVVDGFPSSTVPGRMWNEGLAYYGWIFYLSKFYEVLDTFIILAKGKPSSTLQTYHHAGAMMCMWAGMRYMSAPIWMFVLVNSFIHAMMYTYYTLTAFSIRVPMGIKRTLTSLQITQFLVGASYAMAHSFVSYVVPVTTETNTSAAASPTASIIPSGTLNSLKQLVFGSTGSASQTTTYTAQPCIVTAGETFAIWLNVVYLAPLTYLFVSFFIASYVKRSNAAHKINGRGDMALAEKAGWDAARGVEREVYGGENMVNGHATASAADDEKKSTRNRRKVQQV